MESYPLSISNTSSYSSISNNNSSSSNSSSSIGYFEGPEKKLEVDFVFGEDHHIHNKNNNNQKGLLNVSQDAWSQLLKAAKCEIVGAMENEHCKSFVLSESSLFVYATKALIKTCGTTTILAALEPLLELGHSVGLRRSFVSYSRKNYSYPEGQRYPHRSFKEEVDFLDQRLEGGVGIVLGNPNGGDDHWYQYVADYSSQQLQPQGESPAAAAATTEMTLEVCMHDLSPQKMKRFFKHKEGGSKSAEEATARSGIASLLPGSQIDAFQFDPCGYSMNGLLEQFYSTIHITPESHCSYASFETNMDFDYLRKKLGKTPEQLIKDVLDCFEPGRFTVVLFKDSNPKEQQLSVSEIELDSLVSSNNSPHKLKAESTYEFEEPYSLQFASFVSNNNSNKQQQQQVKL